MSSKTWRRPSGRQPDALRPVTLTTGFTKHAAGSVLATFGDTRVICTASFEKGVPRFLRGTGRGWLTCEYGMLPGSTHTRTDREAARGRQGGRTMEIQRLIGRALRAAVDLERLGRADDPHRLRRHPGRWRNPNGIDYRRLRRAGLVPRTHRAPGLSGTWWRRSPLAYTRELRSWDLDYPEDSNADTDMNVVMIEGGGFIEVQGTAEIEPFSREALTEMLALAESGIERLFAGAATRAGNVMRADEFLGLLLHENRSPIRRLRAQVRRHSPLLLESRGLEQRTRARPARRRVRRPCLHHVAVAELLFGPAYKGIPIAVATSVARWRGTTMSTSTLPSTARKQRNTAKADASLAVPWRVAERSSSTMW